MNKKLILSLMIILMGFQTQAQEDEKWSLRFATGITKANVNQAFTPTSNAFAPQIGGSLAYKLAKRWEISAGLVVAQRGYRRDGFAQWGSNNFIAVGGEEDLILGPGGFPDPVFGCPLPTGPVGSETAGNRFLFTMLEVPLAARFYLTQKKLQVYLSPGLTYHLPVMFTATSRFLLEDGSIDQVKDRMFFPPSRRVPLTVSLSAGARYPISDNIQIYAQTGLDKYFHSFGDQPVNSGWNSDIRSLIGIEIGL